VKSSKFTIFHLFLSLATNIDLSSSSTKQIACSPLVGDGYQLSSTTTWPGAIIQVIKASPPQPMYRAQVRKGGWEDYLTIASYLEAIYRAEIVIPRLKLPPAPSYSSPATVNTLRVLLIPHQIRSWTTVPGLYLMFSKSLLCP